MTRTVGSPGSHSSLSKQATTGKQMFASSWIHVVSHFLLLSILGVFPHCVLLSCTEWTCVSSDWQLSFGRFVTWFSSALGIYNNSVCWQVRKMSLTLPRKPSMWSWANSQRFTAGLWHILSMVPCHPSQSSSHITENENKFIEKCWLRMELSHL